VLSCRANYRRGQPIYQEMVERSLTMRAVSSNSMLRARSLMFARWASAWPWLRPAAIGPPIRSVFKPGGCAETVLSTQRGGPIEFLPRGATLRDRPAQPLGSSPFSSDRIGVRNPSTIRSWSSCFPLMPARTAMYSQAACQAKPASLGFKNLDEACGPTSGLPRASSRFFEQGSWIRRRSLISPDPLSGPCRHAMIFPLKGM